MFIKVPVKLNIPNKYVKDIASGTIDISKAVLRNKDNGKIIKYTDLCYNSKETAKDVIENVGIKNLGIAGLVVGSVALIGFGIYKVVNIFNKDKKIELPKGIKEFHKKLNKYLEEANKGILNVDSIDHLLKSIDEIEKLNDSNIKIDFSTQEVKELFNSVYKFTTKLNKKDKNNKIKFKAPSNSSSDNIIYLKEYLEYQKNLAVVG